MLLAPALRSLLASFGIELPSTGTVIAARTVIVGLLVGMIATLVSGLVPGAARDAGGAGRGDARRRHAGRQPRQPQAAARVDRASSASGSRRCCSACSAAPAALPRPRCSGSAMVVMIFGVALLAPVLVRPLARVIGAPLQRFQGMPGRLARENAERQPQRTAITASALMIGLALVVFTAIFAAGLRGSIDKVIDEQLSAARR